MTGKKNALQAILLIFVFFLGLSLFINLPATYRNFLFADQAVYLAMTQSIAHDGDLEFTKQDLVRYYRDIDSGPQGVALMGHSDSPPVSPGRGIDGGSYPERFSLWKKNRVSS